MEDVFKKYILFSSLNLLCPEERCVCICVERLILGDSLKQRCKSTVVIDEVPQSNI